MTPKFRDPFNKKKSKLKYFKIFIIAAVYDFYLFWAIWIWLGRSKVTTQLPRWAKNCQNVTAFLQTKNYGKIIKNSRFIPDADDDPSNHPTASTIFLVRSKSEIQRSKLIELCWICLILKQYFDCTWWPRSGRGPHRCNAQGYPLPLLHEQVQLTVHTGLKFILIDEYFFDIWPGIILTFKLILDNRMKRRSAYENHVSSNFVHEILQRTNCFIHMIIRFEINIKPDSIYMYIPKTILA